MIQSMEMEYILLMILAVIVAVSIQKIKLPYTIALVFMGLIASLARLKLVPLSKDVIFFLFLPPLLFEGAVHIELRDLKENILTISLLSVAGIVISVLIIGYGLFWLTGMPLIYGLLFGAIICPTDPVSVLALFKKLGVSRRLSTIVEGESLFNDGTGVVIYEIILGLIMLHHFSLAGTIFEFFKVVAGGFVLGGIFGFIVYSILKKIDDYLVEVMITIILAYGTFVTAETLHVSGVISVVVSGILIGNFGTRFAMSPTTRLSILQFWEIIVFLVNSLIFILIGATIPIKGFLDYTGYIGIAIVLVLLSRSFSVYLISNITNFFKEITPLKWQHTINWGGLHGSIPIALILGIQTLDINYKEPITYMAFGVIFFSLVVQGLTMSPLLKILKLIEYDPADEKAEIILARKVAIKKAREELTRLNRNGEISDMIYKIIIDHYDDELADLKKNFEEHLNSEEDVMNKHYRNAEKLGLITEKTAIIELAQKGMISKNISRKLIDDINLKLNE